MSQQNDPNEMTVDQKREAIQAYADEQGKRPEELSEEELAAVAGAGWSEAIGEGAVGAAGGAIAGAPEGGIGAVPGAIIGGVGGAIKGALE